MRKRINDIFASASSIALAPKIISKQESMNSEVLCESESSSSNTHDIAQVVIAPNSDSEAITGKENKAVYRYKILAAIIMLAACVFVATCVHILVARSENTEFEEQFRKDAETLMNGLGMSVARSLTPIDALAVMLVSHARSVNETWPFVTLPDHALKLSKILPFTDAIIILVHPLVQPEERSEWEKYTSLKNGWINESIAIQETWDKFPLPISHDWVNHDTIYGDNGDIPANTR